ncbi:sporulation/spore germination protein [Desulfitobacterium dichloroeliminans LMG P-21439]|uniref:Sporulation/spore germination protein n=2 Tax=Desulfitobacterium dichloroeliminans TaxID=233055 RepID=L0F582_DESDL|nr:GerMN domain-containing protein [Desulfitobacterium dichloroeliminans]AGA68190.1 sporulation/spore germination protein [Desulfitobacterium dichloroeliminans LMG P-21439]
MKKYTIIIGIMSLLGALLLLGGCGTTQENPPTGNNPGEQPAQEDKFADYLAYQDNTRYVYEGQGNEYASYTTYVDYSTGDRVQLRTNNGGTEMVRVLVLDAGQIIQQLAQGETYYRENLTKSSKLNSKGEVLLKEPLTKGTTWTLPDNRKRTITNVDMELSTPSGNYKVIEVTTEGEDSAVMDYYAPNVGLVKSVFKGTDNYEVTSTLSKLEKSTPLVQNVKAYYPNIDDGKIHTTTIQLSFKTNDITKQVFEQEFKKKAANQGKLIGDNVKIKSLHLNQDGRVYVDFTKNLVAEMNAGAGYEGMILQSIANTLGDYYGVSEVNLTLEGEPYASGHVEMKKGEFFKVDHKNVVEKS